MRLASVPSIAPLPRLHLGVIAAPALPAPAAGQIMEDAAVSQDGPPDLSASPPPSPRLRPPREKRPGEIILPPGRRSLGRLYKLEEEIAQIPGVGDAMVHVMDDGHVLITVPPHAEGRVREYLGRQGELSGGGGG